MPKDREPLAALRDRYEQSGHLPPDARIRLDVSWLIQRIKEANRSIAEISGRANRIAIKLAAIGELHRPVDRGTGPQCVGCETSITFEPWPCETAKILMGEQVTE